MTKRIGLGCMRLETGVGGPAEASELLIVEALNAGVGLLDTANVYYPVGGAPGDDERLVRRALARWGGDAGSVTVATKGGLTRPGRGRWLPDGRAGQLRAACEASREALGVECIDLYQLHAPDPRTKLETSMRALAKLRDAGLVQDVGVCNVTLSELRRAQAVVPISSVQVEISPFSDEALRGGVAEACIADGIQLIAHSPFGGPKSRRKLARHPALQAIASRRGASPHQVALAWLLGLSPQLTPIPGPTRLETLRSCLRAGDLALGADDIETLDAAFPAGRLLRTSRAERSRAVDPTRGEVVLLMGYPGAGKTTAVRPFVEAGYHRLNRDVIGGSLTDVAKRLDEDLSAGVTRAILDNTYAKRSARNAVVEAAWRHGLPARCVWLQTDLAQAQVNACQRMVERFGRLLEPDEIKVEARTTPNTYAPRVQMSYRAMLEDPALDEGFAQIVAEPFLRRTPVGQGRAVVVSAETLLVSASGLKLAASVSDLAVPPPLAAALARRARTGWLLAGLGWFPDVPGGPSADDIEALWGAAAEAIGAGLQPLVCRHGGGAPTCWCRPPLPGLAVQLIHQRGLDPSACLLVGASRTDHELATALGMPFVEASGA